MVVKLDIRVYWEWYVLREKQIILILLILIINVHAPRQTSKFDPRQGRVFILMLLYQMASLKGQEWYKSVICHYVGARLYFVGGTLLWVISCQLRCDWILRSEGEYFPN